MHYQDVPRTNTVYSSFILGRPAETKLLPITPRIYGTRKSFTVPTSARHLTLS
jgi:hypothetical protein